MANPNPVSKALKATRQALDQVDPDQPGEALPLLREAAENLTEAINEAMAAAVLDEGATLRSAGALAGLSENAVGPRLAMTDQLSAYSSDSGRVTAKGVERALYDKELGRTPSREATGAAPKPQLRFRTRRPSD